MSILDEILNSSSKEDINQLINDKLTDLAVDVIVNYSPEELTEVSASVLGRYTNAANKDKASKQMKAYTGHPDNKPALLSAADKRVKGIEQAGAKLAVHRERADKEQLSKNIADLPNKKSELEKHKADYAEHLKKNGGGGWMHKYGYGLNHDERTAKNIADKIDALARHIHHTEKRAASLKEDTDQIDELSKSTLGSYIKKSSIDTSKHIGDRDKSIAAAGDHWYNPDEFEKHTKDAVAATHKMLKRKSGLAKAVDKITKEDTDQIDELDKSTLVSYIGKAAVSTSKLSAAKVKSQHKSDRMTRDYDYDSSHKQDEITDRLDKKKNARVSNIMKAASKLGNK